MCKVRRFIPPKAKRAQPLQVEAIPEDFLLERLVELFDLGVNPDDAELFAVPNGGHRNAAVAGKLKAAGVRSGVSDLVLIGRNRLVVWIEVKRPEVRAAIPGKAKPVIVQTRGTLSKSQIAFRDRVTRWGFEFRVVETCEEFLAVLAEFGVPCRARMMGRAIFAPLDHVRSA